MARKDSFNQPWASVPAQFERPGDGLIARGWAGGASEDPPEAKWENWWHNRVDLALQELQNLGQLIWFADAPYKAGARVNYGGNSFIALSNNTGVEPTGLLDVGVWRKESTKTYLQTANNLSEIKAAGPVAVAQAIDNLGLKDTAATAAGALQKTQNLNDVANKTTALANLGALPANGTAVSATKLATARTIAGKSFDGTANISIGAADVGALPSGGTAVAATKLATSRTIAGKSFDGTANISIAADDVGALPLTGGALSGSLTVNGTHDAPLGPGGFRSCLMTPVNGGMTNPGGTGIGLHSSGVIYFWNDNAGYAASLSSTEFRVNRSFSAGAITGSTVTSTGKVSVGNGSASLETDGNINGTVWGGGLLSNYINAMRSTSSLAANGWWRDPVSKMIIQWCTGPGVVNETKNVVTNFPIPFPSACLIANVSTKNPAQDTNSDLFFQVASWDKNSAVCILQMPGSATSGAALYPIVIAIGF
ncbi:hypothetical protein [Yersinia rochesterensis]|uniref:gp53-like domain-containing protein n=1 Tax=Yersinia rochesterensis TaxID=1604335 RepID=UPI001643B2E0|nr:hypothetical protein [Yersinia rochesterensis]